MLLPLLVLAAFFAAWVINAAVRGKLSFHLLLTDIGALDMAAADAVLKDDYKAPVVDMLNNANVGLAMIEANTKDFVGRRAIQPIHVGRNSGIGSRQENETLPAAGNQQYEDVFIPMRYHYARIQLSGPVIAAMAKDRGSFMRALDPEMEGVSTDAVRDQCRQFWGTSDGKICGVDSVGPGTTITPPSIRQDQLRHLDEGFLIDIGTAADPDSIASSREVLTVNYDTGAITISGANVTVVAGTHFIFRHGDGGSSTQSGNPGDGQRELTGMQTHVSATLTDHTLSPSTEPRWAANEFTNSGNGNRSISETLISKALMKTSIKSGAFVDIMIAGDGVYLAYEQQLATMRRTTTEVDLKGGFTGIAHSAVMQGRNKQGQKTAICWDQDCPDNRLYGLTLKSFQNYVLQDWDWIDKMGSKLVQVGDTDAFSATLSKYNDIGCNKRNANFVITELAIA